MNRFFVGESEVCGNQVVLVKQQAHQICGNLIDF
jgi:hypothetical protein